MVSLRQFSGQRTIIRSGHTSASKCWWLCSPRYQRNYKSFLIVYDEPFVISFSQCSAARNMLDGAGDLKRKWTWAVEWLHDELERGGGHRWFFRKLLEKHFQHISFSRAPYANTASSNETANGYFLERSHSARLTLEKACELMPEEEVEKTL